MLPRRFRNLYILGGLLLVVASPSRATWDEIQTTTTSAQQIVFRLFERLSSTYRPTGGEAQARKLVRSLYDWADKNVWEGQLEIESDPTGNLLIRVPGTGIFEGKKMPSVALQAHLDMVLALDSEIKGDAESNFINGVELERSGDWIESKGRRTSLGADNGIGVSILMAYLLRKEQEHVPLELLFTVHEEIGLEGARNLKIPLKSNTLINIDGEREGVVYYGCSGSERVLARASLPLELEPADGRRLLHLRIHGLDGGHSGQEIHLKKANAALAMVAVLKELKAECPDMGLVEFRSGTPATLNAIPSLCHADVAVPLQCRARLAQKASEVFVQYLKQYSDEDGALDIDSSPLFGAPYFSLKWEFLSSFFGVLSDLKNGVVTQNVAYPFDVETSSSLGFVELFKERDEGTLSIGYMARSFVDSELDKVVAENNETLRRLATSEVSPKSAAKTRPWMSDPLGWLPQFALSQIPRSILGVEAGAVEMAVFQDSHPNLASIEIGPTIMDPHSVRERVNWPSVERTILYVDRLVSKLPGCPEFLAGFPPPT